MYTSLVRGGPKSICRKEISDVERSHETNLDPELFLSKRSLIQTRDVYLSSRLAVTKSSALSLVLPSWYSQAYKAPGSHSSQLIHVGGIPDSERPWQRKTQSLLLPKGWFKQKCTN
jgi:hypothetical protein